MKTSESIAPYKIKEVLAFRQAWWYVSIIPEQEMGDRRKKCKVILSYIESSRPTQKKRRMEEKQSNACFKSIEKGMVTFIQGWNQTS